jgi:hypothetical protein
MTMTVEQLNQMLREYRKKYLQTICGNETYIRDDERSILNDYYGKKIIEIENLIRGGE